ncbi:MAG: hypothetical protein SOR95_08090 [Sutterella sp.]|nr:hypothetical protein [Sutterella sp.]
MNFNRRTLLGLMGLGVVAPAAFAADAAKKREWPKKPSIPTDFNAEEFFVELDEKGEGVLIPGPQGGPTVYIVFDSQCPWCQWQYEQFKPFLGQVTFKWFPVAVLSPWSELQGAYILSAEKPYDAFLEHEKHFKDPEFRGVDVRGKEFPMEKRTAVWTNSKIARRAGTRTVPFMVMRTPDGKYVPLNETKTEDFAKASGLTPKAM